MCYGVLPGAYSMQILVLHHMPLTAADVLMRGRVCHDTCKLNKITVIHCNKALLLSLFFVCLCAK